MGFFSGSFGQGLVTGLAQGAERTIKTALDKRDEELSSARKYLRERRAQKEERAEAYDLRAEKALKRLSKETGSTSRGLALYQHFGDIDAVEQFIKDVDETARKQPGKGFKMKDALDWAEANEGSLQDITMDDAFQSIRYEYTDPSIDFTDTSGLEKLGLGLSAERSQELVGGSPLAGKAVGFKRKPIEGLQQVTVNREKLFPAIEYAYQQAANEKELGKIDLTQEYRGVQAAIAALDPNAPDYAEQKSSLQKKGNAILASIKAEANAKDPDGQSGSVAGRNLLRNIFDDELQDAYLRNGINLKDGTFKDADGNPAFQMQDPEGWKNATTAAREEAAIRFVANQKQADGSFSSDAMYIIRSLGLSSYTTPKKEEEAQQAETTAGTTAQQPKMSQDELDEKVRTKLPDAGGYVDNILAGVKSASDLGSPALQKLFNDIQRIYGVSADEATVILDNAIEAKETAPVTQLPEKPVYKTKAERLAEEEERKRLEEEQAQNVQSSSFAFSPEG